MRDLIEGTLTLHPRGFGFLDVDGPEAISAFVPPPALNRFLDGDRVRAELERSDDGRYTARDLALLERTRTELYGTAVKRQGRAYLRVDRRVSNTDWPLQGDDLTDDRPVIAVIEGDLARAVRFPEPAEAGLECVIARHGLRTTFPEAAIEAARSTGRAKMRLTPDRRDLTKLPTVTIDAPVSRDLDDALSVLPADEDGALRLFVSIADVDEAVPEGSPTDEEARLRTTSVYLAGKVVPMLPRVLSEKALSLLPGEPRHTLTAELRIDPEGRVHSVDLYPSMIRSTARLSYTAVASFLETDEPGELPAEVLSTLRWLRTAASRVARDRAARGGVRWAREEASLTLDEAGEPVGMYARPSTVAHDLVEKLMVAANEAVARWLHDRGLPALYRVHDEPDEQSVNALTAAARQLGFEAGFGSALSPRALAALEQQLESSRHEDAMYTLMGSVLGRARYTTEPGAHFGLAAPLYLHFTSPIRRYADLTVHRVVKAFLRGQRAGFDQAPLERLAERINAGAARAQKAERERHAMLAARLLSARIGEQFEGRVVATRPQLAIVRLEALHVSGSLATDDLPGGPFKLDEVSRALVGKSARYDLGQRVEVKIAETNEQLGQIVLALVR